MKILIDADMVIFQACSIVEQVIEWEPDFFTLHADAAEAKRIVDDRVQSLVEKVLNHYQYTGSYEIIMCISAYPNFRYDVLSTYKSNRKGKRKPICYNAVCSWVKEEYKTCCKDGLEADDCLGILATKHKNSIIVSGDKDMKQIPGRFFDFSRDVFYDHTAQEADFWFFYQCLVGDATDGYSGCPGIGDKTAQKLLEEEGVNWRTVVRAYEKKKLSEDVALQQARVARILRNVDYDFKAKKVKLWEAPSDD